jgi:hypothetical protein
MTAVQLLKQEIDLEIRLGTKMIVNWDAYLEIERLQLADAQSYAISNADMTNNRGYFDCDKWYNETYGSKGSKIGSSLEWNGEVTQGHSVPASSKTEISDEEILQAGVRYYEPSLRSVIQGFTEGAKWYREQLKKQ